MGDGIIQGWTYVPAATDNILLERVFSTRSVQSGNKEENGSKNISVGREPPFREDLRPEAEE
jgi:hypothetical protein